MLFKYIMYMCKTFWLSSDIDKDTFLSRYLKSKEVWREDPAPGWVIHQVQNAVYPRQSLDGSKQVNPVPVVTRVLTHRLHLLQILNIHIVSTYVPNQHRICFTFRRLPPELMSQR